MLKPYLKAMVDKGASDLYLSAGAPASIKIEGNLEAVEQSELTAEQTHSLGLEVMNEKQQAEFAQKKEMNLALLDEQFGRFRVNIFRQNNETALVLRLIHSEIPSFSDLGLPELFESLSQENMGLILFVGATGSGKSTSLASLINYRNENSAGHIITIEDPIEYQHPHKKSIVNQREIGIDTLSYQNALQNTLRQAPDVILIGEIRTHETMEHAISFAETGHLCLSTLHANNTYQALERIVSFFPESQHTQLFLNLSLNLKAIVAQRLVKGKDGKRLIALEILLASPLIRELIKKGAIDDIKAVLDKSEHLGMQSMDCALEKLAKSGKITLEEALKNADSENNLRLKLNDSNLNTDGLRLKDED